MTTREFDVLLFLRIHLEHLFFLDGTYRASGHRDGRGHTKGDNLRGKALQKNHLLRIAITADG